jgi:hypothetical protein
MKIVQIQNLFKSENYSNFKIVQISNLLKFKIVQIPTKPPRKLAKKQNCTKQETGNGKKIKKIMACNRAAAHVATRVGCIPACPRAATSICQILHGTLALAPKVGRLAPS